MFGLELDMFFHTSGASSRMNSEVYGILILAQREVL